MNVSRTSVSAIATIALAQAAQAGDSAVEQYIGSIRSGQQVKEAIRSALDAACVSGVCINNNHTEICSVLGALDLQLDGLVSAETKQQAHIPKPKFTVDTADLQLFRRIWKQCRPTTYQYWNWGSVLHVWYDPEPTEDKEIRRALGLPPSDAGNATGTGATQQPSTSTPQRAAKPSTTSNSDVTKKLTYCLMPKAQFGQYSSFDGGKSALALLQQCPSETIAWIDDCASAGDTKQSCQGKALIAAQAVIKMFDK